MLVQILKKIVEDAPQRLGCEPFALLCRHKIDPYLNLPMVVLTEVKREISNNRSRRLCDDNKLIPGTWRVNRQTSLFVNQLTCLYGVKGCPKLKF